jgi:hypothetical protein
VHAGGRRKGKGRSRILYWFRTPPGVRVGRAALDEEAIRLIEEYNPELDFDWTRILKEQDAETRPAPPKDRDYRAERIARRQTRAVERARPVGPGEPATRVSERPPEGRQLPAVDIDDVAAEASAVSAPGETPADPAASVRPEDSVPQEDQVDSDDAVDPDADVAPPRPSLARLGAEGLARLRARYAEVLARISERVPDPERQAELKSQAERLNPDSWVTDPEVTAGLEAYESVFDALRSAVGGPNRRRRRRRRKDGGPAANAPSEESGQIRGGEAEAADPAGDDPDENL